MYFWLKLFPTKFWLFLLSFPVDLCKLLSGSTGNEHREEVQWVPEKYDQPRFQEGWSRFTLNHTLCKLEQLPVARRERILNSYRFCPTGSRPLTWGNRDILVRIQSLDSHIIFEYILSYNILEDIDFRTETKSSRRFCVQSLSKDKSRD